jgi:predicted RNA-binding protein with PUA-like domain
MALWLLKTEPSEYSWDDLVRDKQTVWEGVTNPTALIHIREMKKGDLALLYHTGSERATIGIAQIARGAYPDPKAGNPKIVVVDVKPKKELANPVSLDQIKSDKTFAGWDLLRIGRLSVVPVPQKMWDRILELSNRSSNDTK